MLGDAQASMLYIANWHFLGEATNYFADPVEQSPFLHFWSLAVEEQFYLGFPLLLVALTVSARRTARPVIVPVGLGIVLLLSLGAQIRFAASSEPRAYYGTDARLYQLLAGALLAVLLRPAHRKNAIAMVVATGAMLVGVVVVASSVLHVAPTTRGIVATAFTVGAIIAVEAAPTSPLARLLAWRSTVYLGRISYGTYLWHWPLIVFAEPIVGLGPWGLALCVSVGATGLAALSYHSVESPIRRSRSLARLPRPSVVVGIAASVTVALVVAPPLLHSQRRPVVAVPRPDVSSASLPAAIAAGADAVLDARVPTGLPVDATQPPSFDRSGCTASTPQGCVLRRGDGVHLHVIGDSNAQALVPTLEALAKSHDLTLSVTTLPGCPWQIGLSWDAANTELAEDCLDARPTWYEEILPALEPDLIIATNVPRDEGARVGSLWVVDDDNRDVNAAIEAATATTLDIITRNGARAVILEPLPYSHTDPTRCLSGAAIVADCAYLANTDPFPSEQIARRLDAGDDDVFVVDYDTIACPLLPLCLPLIDGELVFRNQFHLSNQWLIRHRDELWNLVATSGALDHLRPNAALVEN